MIEFKENEKKRAYQKLQQEVIQSLPTNKNGSYNVSPSVDEVDNEVIKPYITENLLLRQLNHELIKKN